MKYLPSLLVLLSAVAAIPTQAPEPLMDLPFTVNLLTLVEDVSINFTNGPSSINNPSPMSWSNATDHQLFFGNVTYSLIGSTTFTKERCPQEYHIDTNQWDADISIELRKRGQLAHLDIAVSKERDGKGMRFDYLTPDTGEVDVNNVATRLTPKLVPHNVTIA